MSKRFLQEQTLEYVDDGLRKDSRVRKRNRQRGKILITVLLILLAAGVALYEIALNSAPAGEQENVFRVVLDAGHGGEDPGAVVGDVQEKNINLAVALLVQEQLKDREGLDVCLTRDEDVFVSLKDRADFANKSNADLFVSIHANALEGNEGFSGIMTFYHPDKMSSEPAADLIHCAVLAASDGVDRGVRSENYAVLRDTKMRAILIETGFMTCPEELALLQDLNYQTLLAEGIAQGILDCMNNTEST